MSPCDSLSRGPALMSQGGPPGESCRRAVALFVQVCQEHTGTLPVKVTWMVVHGGGNHAASSSSMSLPGPTCIASSVTALAVSSPTTAQLQVHSYHRAEGSACWTSLSAGPSTQPPCHHHCTYPPRCHEEGSVQAAPDRPQWALLPRRGLGLQRWRVCSPANTL